MSDSSFQVKRLGGLKVREVTLRFANKALFVADAKIPLKAILGWELERGFFVLSYESKNERKQEAFQCEEQDFYLIQKAFQDLRIKSSNQKGHLKKCSNCLSSILDKKEKITYCPECQAIYSEEKDYTKNTNFTAQGYFLELFPESASETLQRLKSSKMQDALFFKAKKNLQKTVNHLLWMGIWIGFYWGAGKLYDYELLPKVALWSAMAFFMVMAFFHLFVVGYHHSYIMMRKALKKFSRPSKEEKLLRSAMKGDESSLKIDYDHPGVLYNLALHHLKEGKVTKAKELLERLTTLMPAHPMPLTLLYHISNEDKKGPILTRLTKIARENAFLSLKEIGNQVECLTK